MHYEDYTQTVKYLKLALPEMNRLKVPVTPSNYAVWYDYCAKKNKALVLEIDKLKIKHEHFSPEINDYLYEKFLEKNQTLYIEKLNVGVKSVINNLIQQTQQEQDEIDNYSDTLQTLATDVESITQLSDVEELISRLISESHARANETKAFKKQVVSMAEEVTSLDEQLKLIALDANTDALTGIFNRRAFNQKIAELIEDNRDNESSFSLAMIDIDHFKKLNDTFGHLSGDNVLKFIASMIKKNIRGNDFLARFGGEEFVVILPNTKVKNALCVGDNIRTFLARQKLYDSTENKQIGQITLSIGISAYRQGESAQEVIERADKCLYRAKAQGRNKTIGEDELGTEDRVV